MKSDYNLKNEENKVAALIARAAASHNVDVNVIEYSLKMKYDDFMSDPKMKFFFKDFNPKKKEIVLDVGCWTGTYDYILSQLHPETTFLGYDIVPEYIDLANASFQSKNCRFVCRNLFDAKELKPNSINHIFFFEVLEHVDSPKHYLDLFYRLLRPGGRLYLATPSALGITNILLNIKNQSLRYIEEEPRNTGTEKDHIYVWDKLTLFRLLNRCGFKLDKFYLSRKYSIFNGQSLCFIVRK